MTPVQKERRGGNLIREFAALKAGEKFPPDLGCLKLWTKARLHAYGTQIADNQEMQVLIAMAIETAYRMGLVDGAKDR